MKGTFPKDFSQVATSQGYYPKCHLPKGIFPSGNFLNVQFPKRQLPKSALAAALSPQYVPATALGPISNPCRSARPPPIAACGPSEGVTRPLESCRLGHHCTFGKLLLGKFSLGKSPLGKCLWECT